ncbi:MATE family efflux transporter [Salaquimonas pukyongi]|uniref:MATE family efflux transporter n=1 Tax=Salaquimonas pukyongi TaxID=2712698 RepID=UPI00096B7B89|nr:MATE family efflux transporter [Salaquimonas pukyongi]
MDIAHASTRQPASRPFAVTHRMVIGLALPMTLAYMTTPILGLVDTAVVGRLGSAALIGGLAVGAIIIDVAFTTLNFLRSGTTGLTAQAVGREDEKEKQAILFRALVIALAGGLAMIALIPGILWAGLWFMAPGEAVADATSRYFTIRMLGAPFALANYALLGWLIGLGRAGLGLLLQIVLNGTNIVLSIVLGLSLEYGLEGVAWATVVAEALAFAVGSVICWRLLDHTIRPSLQRIFDKAALIRIANLNADIMVRSFLLLLAFAFFTAQGAKFGETVLAANAVLMNFFMVAGFFLDGMATAAEQIVGRAVGAHHRDGFWRGIRLTLFWNTVLALALFGVFWLFGEALINLITTLEPVREEAYRWMIFAALTALTGVIAFQMDGIYIGATWSREMSVMMILSFLAYLAVWWLLRDLGNPGLWIALHSFLIFRGITLSARLPVKANQTFGD